MDGKSIPKTVRHLHLGRNKIKDLNGTLLHLSELEWLLINSNDLTTLEDQLPVTASKLKLIHAAQNKIEHLPKQIKNFGSLESLFMQNNMLTGLEGRLSKSRLLKRAILEHNRINTVKTYQ